MNTKSVLPPNKETSSNLDLPKYIAAGTLLLAGLFVWFFFSSGEYAAMLGRFAPQIRGFAVLLGVVAGGFVFSTSTKGRDTIEFFAESRFELRKVIWPTRQEAVRTMWVVVAVVVLISLILAGFDFFIQKIISWFLGFGHS